MADQRRNVKDKDSQLFKSLTRLFSGPIVNFKQQAQLRFKRNQLNKFKFTSTSGRQFQKSSYNPFDSIQSNIMANQTRAERYSDFDQMEYTPEIASALDIYADEMTTHSSLAKMLHVNSANQEIRGILETLYYDVLNVEFNLFGWCRTMCKFGDMFLYLDIDEQVGIKSAIGLPSPEIERLEGEDKTNPSYVQFQWNAGGLTFENWQIAHFRILGQDKYAPYGTSVLEPARRIWRQLNLMEDAMMAYRIVRAPDRRVFYIDVGNIAPEDIEQYMLKIQAQMKRNMIVDQNTGRVDLRYNPMSIDEDYFVPVRGQSNTKIDTLQGGTFASAIEDVKYLRDKLFSAIKIPQSYLSKGEGTQEDKSTLAQKDIRFARTVQRLQRVVVSELEKIGIIHLFTLGYRNQDLLNFTLTLNNPSRISELQELEHWKTKFEIAAQAKDGFFSKRWIAEHIFNLPERDYKKIQRELYFDKIFEKQLEGAANEVQAVGAATAAAAGEEASAEAGLGGGGGGGLGTPAAGGAEATPAAGGEEAKPAGGTEESPMPVVPDVGGAAAKRKDDYVSVKERGVGDGRQSSGPRTRSVGSAAGYGFGRRESKGVHGLSDTAKISRLINLTEGKDTNYIDQDETNLHEVNRDIKILLASLEAKNAKDKV